MLFIFLFYQYESAGKTKNKLQSSQIFYPWHTSNVSPSISPSSSKVLPTASDKISFTKPQNLKKEIQRTRSKKNTLLEAD